MSEQASTTPETVAPATVNESDGPETNEMPKVAADKLPTIPAELPKVVLAYADTSRRGHVQVKHARNFLADLNEYGNVLLSQHHAEGAAEQRLDNDEEFADERAELETLQSQIEEYLAAVAKIQQKHDNLRNAAIAAIVSKSAGDIDFETAEAEYSTAYTAMTAPGALKNWEAAGEQVHAAIKEFAKSLPTAANLVEGKRKGVRSNSTMPGAGNSEGWKPSFEWLEVAKPGKDFERIDGVTTIGQLAKALDGGKSYERILGTLKASPELGGVAALNDDQIYTWQSEVKNLDDDSTSVTRYRGKALSRATKNARANAAKESSENDSATAASTSAESPVAEPVINK
jgi:hypothetical protein